MGAGPWFPLGKERVPFTNGTRQNEFIRSEAVTVPTTKEEDS